MYFVYFSEKTAAISPNSINRLVLFNIKGSWDGCMSMMTMLLAGLPRNLGSITVGVRDYFLSIQADSEVTQPTVQ
jgi:hypothetical protein